MLDPRTIANAYVRTLLGVIEGYGVAAADVLLGTRVDAAALDAPNGRIGVEDVHRIWARGIALTKDPLLGLKVAAATKPTTFRVLGLATMSSASLADALALMLRYHRLVSESGVMSAETDANGDVTIHYSARLLRVQQFPQQVEAIVGGMLVMARWLAERPLTPLAVTFRHAPLGDLHAYRQCFGCDPRFDAPEHTLRFAAKDMTRRLPQADADLHRVHRDLLDRQLEGLPQPGHVTAFAQQWLPAQPAGAMRIDDLAQALGMSVRAVQRQLQHEGQSWTHLVDSARKHALEELLAHGLTLEAAAQQLGYHDASSLSRAAKRWFGKSAGKRRLETQL
jgi:AraC-like DNA-binding protein